MININELMGDDLYPALLLLKLLTQGSKASSEIPQLNKLLRGNQVDLIDNQLSVCSTRTVVGRFRCDMSQLVHSVVLRVLTAVDGLISVTPGIYLVDLKSVGFEEVDQVLSYLTGTPAVYDGIDQALVGQRCPFGEVVLVQTFVDGDCIGPDSDARVWGNEGGEVWPWRRQALITDQEQAVFICSFTI